MKSADFIDNYQEVMQSMYEYHQMFYQIAVVGRPLLTEAIPTACVTFDRKQGNYLNFMFNPNFVEELNWNEVRFICCHEMLHVLFCHGRRTRGDNVQQQIANIAMDIVINHSLLDHFGFKKSDLPTLYQDLKDEEIEEGKFAGICFIETVFKEKASEILPGQSFEYYYNKLMENKELVEALQNAANGGALDDHSKLPSMTKEELQDMLEEALGDEDLAKEAADELEKKLKEGGNILRPGGQQAGTGESTTLLDVLIKGKPKKRKWESVVGNIRKTKRRLGAVDDYQWIKPNRRNMLLNDPSLLMPSINDDVQNTNNKWDLWLFQDISGSCVHYAKRFLSAARTIPTDDFNIKFHTFDTRVKAVDINTKKIAAGGGTAFDIIEDYILANTVQKQKAYPRLVFVITDGYGTDVNPKFPKNWFWFLTDNGISDCYPKECKTYDLQDFDGYSGNDQDYDW